MVGIVFLSSFYWYYIHGARMYITCIKRNSIEKYRERKISNLIFSK